MTARIPSWATKVVDGSAKEDASTFITSTRQSASLFRIECARTWQQRIHQAQRKAWTEAVQSMLRREVEPTTPPETSSPLLQRYSLTPTTCSPLDDELLPMTIISPAPSCRLDRQALVEAVWDYYRNDRCCSLWLPKLLPTLHATLHLLVRQCVHLHAPADHEFQLQAARYFRKHQKKRNTSMQQILLWWAARTNAFDSMVIILEDPGGFAQSKVWTEFISTVQEWRQEHGLPISLVVVGNISAFGDSRLRLRRIQPSRTKWMETFWQDLLNHTSQTPFPLPSMDRLEQLVQDYTLEHRSFSRLCEDLVTNVTVFYSHPSRLVWDAVELHPPFLAWFGTHGTAKKWLSTQSGSSKYKALEECQRHQRQLQWWWNWQAKLLPILTTNENGTVDLDVLQPLAELYSSLIGNTEKDSASAPSLPAELKRYLDRAEKATLKEDEGSTRTEEAPFSPEQVQAQTLLYELILLIGQTLKEDDDASHQGKTISSKLSSQEEKDGLQRMIFELFELCIQSMDSLLEKWNEANPLSRTSKPSANKSSKRNADIPSPRQPCHHRQNLVEGLISPARELYGLLQDRWSIPREEWLYHFGGSPQDFVRGVWTLVLAGLIQGKSKRGGNGTMVYYEKVSVVWC